MLGWILAGIQALLAARVVARLLSTARSVVIEDTAQSGPARSVSVVVPVLDEERRLGPCLAGLCAQGELVGEILVIDGGSSDATRGVVLAAAARDARVRLIDAAPVPDGWNGKAWNLETGLRASAAASRFIAMIDADVRPAPNLIAALFAHAQRTGLEAFSVATRQRLADGVDALLHPAMLATLVYRFGIPGSAATAAARVQANGQCFFVSRELLVRTGAIAEARDSRSEDVTIARTLARAGTPVGFYEAADLVTVRMYDGWRETLQGWPRSLPMLDRHAPLAGWFGLVEVLFVQALPPWFAAAVWWNGIDGTPGQRAFLDVQAALVLMRFGVLAGMRRAYERPPLGYWLSPLLDLPVALVLIASALRRRHTWRGRTLVRERPR